MDVRSRRRRREAGRIRAGGRLDGILEALSTNLWLLPMIGVLMAVGLSILLGAIDRHLGQDATAWYLFRGGPEGARSVLSAIATSIMTSTGVVFSVTVLVLQLASSQFSPRVLRTFLADRGTQVALAVFLGTFVYALLALRSVRGATEGEAVFVPSLSVWFGVVLATGAVATFVFFIHHVSQSIRAVNVLRRIGDETRAAIQKLFPESMGDGTDEDAAATASGPPSVIVQHVGPPGVVVALAEDEMWEVATAADVTVSLLPLIGQFVPQGAALFEVRGDPARLDAAALAATVTIARERSIRQDPAFGIRSIVDVAERALSPGVNDPSTAVQALDELHDLLRRLSTRRFPDAVRVDDAGRTRVVVHRREFDDYVRLALEEIRRYGRASVQVVARMRSLTDDILRVAPPSRARELIRQRDALSDPSPA